MIEKTMLAVFMLHMGCFAVLITYMTHHRFRQKRKRKKQQQKQQQHDHKF